MLDWFLNPPPWTLGTAILLGLALIYWDTKRLQAKLVHIGATSVSNNAIATAIDIKVFTNQQLIERVHIFTKRLRSFEAIENGATDVEEMQIKAVSAKVDFALRKESGNAALQNAMKSEVAALELKASDLGQARVNRRLSEFQTQFLQEAAQLRAELSRRTGRPVGGSDDPTTDLLDKGKFEMEALRALANYLHTMADRLPY